MVLMYIKKNLTGPGVRYNAGDVFFISEEGMNKVKKSMAAKGLNGAVGFFDVNELYNPFRYGSTSEMLIVRTGGIGDLVALSSLAAYCWETPIKFITAGPLLPVFAWYETGNVFAKAVSEPLYRNFNPVRASKIRKTTERAYLEGIIEEGGRENWYEIFYGVIGVTKITDDFLRPRLKRERINNKPSSIDPSKKSIVISNRASAPMRSMKFEDIYYPLREVIREMDVNIYVHLAALREADLTFFKEISDDRIKVIPSGTIEDYLLDLYDATVTISVDTAAIHFREGVGRPGIGIYGAFTVDSRVKYYQVTHSFNIKSDCDLQPCFIHQKTQEHVCPKAAPGSTDAPCLGGITPNLYGQISENMAEYLLKALS
jgi:hypothetical protein